MYALGRGRRCVYARSPDFRPREIRTMEIELSEEQRLLRDTCRDFAARELTPNAKRWAREHKYPAEAVKKAFQIGLGGVAEPPGLGGAGMDDGRYALGLQENLRRCSAFVTHSNVAS